MGCGASTAKPTASVVPVEDSTLAKADEKSPQVWVSEPTKRGISLDDLLTFFEAHCGNIAFDESGLLPSFVATSLARRCTRFNQANRLEITKGTVRETQANLYAVCQFFIRPMTKDQGVSMAELLNPAGRLIEFFISHFWGEDFGEFV
eukprot:TRINITY_DN111934_c0_g1_i1.p1 TRINITY_DN111934_c0_g1~~TRINITY_DN111934_c0_g1_i1.p1  ORF type:complete len:148 (+),score=19.31 TRINITY_DN111934_c0_g1_i1:54-497(+)